MQLTYQLMFELVTIYTYNCVLCVLLEYNPDEQIDCTYSGIERIVAPDHDHHWYRIQLGPKKYKTYSVILCCTIGNFHQGKTVFPWDQDYSYMYVHH